LKVLKVLALTKYGLMGASSRVRFFQYFPCLQQAGIQITVQPLLSDELLLARYQRGAYGWWTLLRAYACRLRAMLQRHRFDVLWIEKEALPWWPLSLERAFLRGVPYVLDYDDAIFHNYDLSSSSWVRRLYGRRIDGLMAEARLILAGNRYLTARATTAGAEHVVHFPTVVDLARYASKHRYSVAARPRIVWIGSPSTVPYLLELADTLVALTRRQPFTLRVIGGALSMPGVDVELMDWSAETEVNAIAECDIGIMPLRDSPWEQGKCAYKLIQYMACGLPTVASPVGANCDVVVEGETGFLADTPSVWVDMLVRLLCDVALRQRLGEAGRARVEALYCVQQTAPRLVQLFSEVAG